MIGKCENVAAARNFIGLKDNVQEVPVPIEKPSEFYRFSLESDVRGKDRGTATTGAQIGIPGVGRMEG